MCKLFDDNRSFLFFRCFIRKVKIIKNNNVGYNGWSCMTDDMEF